MKTQVFDSLGAMTRYVESHPRSQMETRGRRSFTGCDSVQEAIAYVHGGASESEQAPTIAMLDKINAGIERTRPEWQASVIGSRVVVPEYMQGLPMPMRRRQHVETQAAPVKLVVDVCVSQGVTRQCLAIRGAAIAALAMRLSETRAVELHIAGGMRPANEEDAIVVTKLDTSPISMAHVVAALTSPQMARAIMFSVGYAMVDSPGDVCYVGWAFQSAPGDDRHTRGMRETLHLEPADVFIPGGYLTMQDDIIRDPIAWVNKYLDAQRELDIWNQHSLDVGNVGAIIQGAAI